MDRLMGLSLAMDVCIIPLSLYAVEAYFMVTENKFERRIQPSQPCPPNQSIAGSSIFLVADNP